MTVEIREIVIRAITSPDEEHRPSAIQTDQPGLDRETVVMECVRKVMAMLKKKEER